MSTLLQHAPAAVVAYLRRHRHDASKARARAALHRDLARLPRYITVSIHPI